MTASDAYRADVLTDGDRIAAVGTLADLRRLADAGVTSVKLFMAYPGVYMVDDGAIYRALCRAGELGTLVALHAENGPVIEVLIA